MKLKALLMTLFAAGLAASLALAQPPGHAKHGDGPGAAVSTTSLANPREEKHGKKKLVLCHKTGLAAHPWVRIEVSRAAVVSHLAQGDLLANGADCGALPRGSTPGSGLPRPESGSTTKAETHATGTEPASTVSAPHDGTVTTHAEPSVTTHTEPPVTTHTEPTVTTTTTRH